MVNKEDGKFESAHDLRRAFGTRWARRVAPAVLKKLMRHRSIETTMRYYVDRDADDLADQLRNNHSERSESAPFNNASTDRDFTPPSAASSGVR